MNAMITLVQVGLILGKCFGMLPDWNWFEVCIPLEIYFGICFVAGIAEAIQERK